MTFAAPILPQDKVIEQVKGLYQQRDQLAIQLDQLKKRLHAIESSLDENEHLKARVQELMDTSYQHFQEEWSRRNTYFPEIYLAKLEDMNAILSPPNK